VIAGHFGFAAGVKSRETATPLWALMLATIWLDVVFVPLFIMKIETVVPIQGYHQTYGGAFIYAAYTHSLVGAALLSVVAGCAGKLAWGLRSAALAELALVLTGGGLYWRAASSVARQAGHHQRLARLSGFLVILFGIAVLGLDFSGVLG